MAADNLEAVFIEKSIVALGEEAWELRKWVYAHADMRVFKVPKDKKRLLDGLSRIMGRRNDMPEVNSVEYNFGSVLTSYAVACFTYAKNVDCIDDVFKDMCNFPYVDSIHEDVIIGAYLKLDDVERAQAVVKNLLARNEDWATSRAKGDKRMITDYKRNRTNYLKYLKSEANKTK